MKKVIIIGNGIAAEILLAILNQDSGYEVAAFSVDAEYISKQTFCGLDVVAIESLHEKFPPTHFSVVLGVGYNNVNQSREQLFERVKELGYSVETYIHPSAVIMPESTIGEGCIVLANSVIEPYATLQDNSVVWSNCTIAHHSCIEKNSWIASGSVIAGEAVVGKNTFIGVGSTVVNKVTLGSYNIIGASSLISKDTQSNEVFLARTAEKHRFDSVNYAKYFIV